jgi:hypothetical protein
MDKENRTAKTGTTPSKNVQAFEDQVGHIGHSIVTQYVITYVSFESLYSTVYHRRWQLAARLSELEWFAPRNPSQKLI